MLVPRAVCPANLTPNHNSSLVRADYKCIGDGVYILTALLQGLNVSISARPSVLIRTATGWSGLPPSVCHLWEPIVGGKMEQNWKTSEHTGNISENV